MPPRKAAGPGASDAHEARAGGSGKTTIRSKAIPPTPRWQAVYIGQTCIGHIMRRDRRGFEAFDINDVSLGLFPDPRSAANAICGKPSP